MRGSSPRMTTVIVGPCVRTSYRRSPDAVQYEVVRRRSGVHGATCTNGSRVCTATFHVAVRCRTRVFRGSAVVNGASRKHPTCATRKSYRMHAHRPMESTLADTTYQKSGQISVRGPLGLLLLQELAKQHCSLFGRVSSKRSPHERRKSDVSDLRKLTMAELGNTRVLRKCGIFLCVSHPDCASLHPGNAGLRGRFACARTARQSRSSTQ